VTEERDRAVRALLERIREDAQVSRRDYLRLLVTVSGGLFVGTGLVAAGAFRRHGTAEGATVEPVRVAASIPPGESVSFAFPNPDDPAIALRTFDGTLVAYSAVCTHLSCAVLWVAESERLECPCHNGVFDPATGGVVAGPPPRPLPPVVLEEREDGVWAVGLG
jgi:Rieske Fe-S protein